MLKNIRTTRHFSTTHCLRNTIYALSTSPSKAAIAVVRVSGPSSVNIASKLMSSSLSSDQRQPQFSMQARKAHLAKLYDPKDNSDSSPKLLDVALVLYFKGPHSYTGEDMVEFHLHGGNAVVRSVLNAIQSLHNPPTQSVRVAEPGEFTMRAFRNNKLDLTQVEGIRDIIDAETEYQRQSAVASAEGEAKTIFQHWRKVLVDNIALCTVLIDFTEDNYDIQAEDDAAGSNALLPSVMRNVQVLLDDIKAYQSRLKVSELLKTGIKVNFLGPPNAGKSSILNKMVQREAAIVSEIPGTTRDIVEISVDLAGFKVVLGDTAGLRNLDLAQLPADARGQYSIEAAGIQKTISRLNSGDITLVVVPTDIESLQSLDIIKEQLDTIRDYKPDHQVLLIINKLDLLESENSSTAFLKFRDVISTKLGIDARNIVGISCQNEQGFPDLNEKVAGICRGLTESLHTRDLSPMAASQRVKDLLENNVIAGLQQFQVSVQHNDIVVGIAELEFAAEGISKITGENVTVDEVLGVVFGGFCIGK